MTERACNLTDDDVRTLRAFCALLQNGGMDAFRNALELGRLWGAVRVTVAVAFSGGVVTGLLWLLVWGALWFVRSYQP